ncbi:hypothetical protein MKX01_014490 [Papaver californicum]|nr:hypothetical protein MKX01_014490 [Papaver californicum]
MGKYITIIHVTLFFFCRYAVANEAVSTTKHYIVYMGDHSFSDSNSVISSNNELLASITGNIREAEQATTHHYHKSFRGFSAKLTPEQAQKLRDTETVISVFESKSNQLLTTHSWEFLGVDVIPQNNELTKIDSKSDVIVGVLDTGIWPESESFDDKELGPVPKRFNGKCVTGDKFLDKNCNRKIIGARFYSQGYEAKYGPLESQGLMFFRSPRDSEGHGTHTASTIAGSIVHNVSLFGIASGTARGGIPNARLAIYKVCWPGFPGSCEDADILSAFDDAIHDGVDIISMSLGEPPRRSTSLFKDVLSIGSFHAFKNNILVSASAGNEGTPGSVAHISPWTLTVAASSINRELNSNVQLGNSRTLKGSSINPIDMDKFYEVIFAADAAIAGVPKEYIRSCYNGTLDHNLIKGKIVVCTATTYDSTIFKGIVVRDGGGVGMILIDDDPLAESDYVLEHVIPTTVLEPKEIPVLREYLTSNQSLRKPTAMIHSTTTNISKAIQAPKMAVFSSMGPNIVAPDIIKPDITAPGVRILAAWSPVAFTQFGSVSYKFESGTSMSCPHVSAVAAIIKSHHPSWSPAAIKSAIMTTATVTMDDGTPISKNPSGSFATAFDYGSGHINPVAALDPGLIYDFNTTDIYNFLCSSPGLFPNLVTCPNPPIPTYDLNYPSIGVANMNGSVTVIRTVTYCGHGPAVFDSAVILDNPAGVKMKVTVKPKQLKFKEAGEKMKFSVQFVSDETNHGSLVFGSLTWSYGNKYKVRSPIGLNLASAIQVLGK